MQDDTSNGTQPGATAQAQAAAGTVSGMSDTWVLLNDINYNKTSAQVLDDDGNPVSASALHLGMQLGMQIDVQAAQVDTVKAAATATNIAFGASVEGLVDSVDAAAGQLVVLGQTLQVSDGTVFANGLSNGLVDVAAGNLAKVQGVLDAKTGITAASRVEVKKSVRRLRLGGVTSEVDIAAKTVKIGGQVVNFSSAKVGVSLADGQVVRSLLETEKVNGQFVAKQIGADRRFVTDGEAVDVSASVDEVTSPTSFKVLGLAVDASNATITNGAALKVGARAEVKGALSGGTLVATSVNVNPCERQTERQGQCGGTARGLVGTGCSQAHVHAQGRGGELQRQDHVRRRQRGRPGQRVERQLQGQAGFGRHATEGRDDRDPRQLGGWREPGCRSPGRARQPEA